MAHLRNNLGSVSERRGNLEQAEHWFEQARVELQEAGDRRGAASCLQNMARLARARGRLDAAADMCAECLALRRELNDLNGVALSLIQLSSIRADQAAARNAASRAATLSEARAFAEDALEIWAAMRNSTGQAQGLLQVAELLMLQGEPTAAAPFFAKAFVASRQCKDQMIVVEVQTAWAKCAEAMGEHAMAVRLLRQARRLLWRSPVVTKLTSTNVPFGATPPREVRRLVEILIDLSTLHERRAEHRSAAWCLRVAAWLASVHPALPARAKEAYAEFRERRGDLLPSHASAQRSPAAEASLSWWRHQLSASSLSAVATGAARVSAPAVSATVMLAADGRPTADVTT
jgi:tetratricopeptide (TPR) repeat protein